MLIIRHSPLRRITISRLKLSLPDEAQWLSVNNPAPHPSLVSPCLAAQRPTPAIMDQENSCLTTRNSLLSAPFHSPSPDRCGPFPSRLACPSANLSLHPKPAPSNLQKPNPEPSRPTSHCVVRHGFCAETALTCRSGCPTRADGWKQWTTTATLSTRTRSAASPELAVEGDRWRQNGDGTWAD